jgi:hypothetical protein
MTFYRGHRSWCGGAAVGVQQLPEEVVLAAGGVPFGRSRIEVAASLFQLFRVVLLVLGFYPFFSARL